MDKRLDLDRYKSVPKLAVSLSAYELAVVQGAVDVIIDHFKAKGAVASALNVHQTDGTRFQVRFSYEPISRGLNLFLVSAATPTLTIEEIMIARVGAIRTVRLSWPPAIARRNRILLRALEAFVNNRYIELKEHYLALENSAQGAVVNRVWPLLRSEFEKRNRGRYVDFLAPTLTALKSLEFRYLFDERAIIDVLQHFEDRPSLEYSAISLAMALSLEEVGHTANRQHRNFADGATIMLAANQFVSFDVDRRIFQAETVLLGESQFVDFNVCQISDRLFQVGMPAGCASIVVPILTEIRSDLAEAVQNSLSMQLRFLKAFKAIPHEKGQFAFQLGKYTAGVVEGIRGILQGGVH